MITLYGIKNCDTIKKAKKWLNQNKIEFKFHDHRSDGINKEQLFLWCEELGWEQVLNRRGTTWRKLEDDVKTGINETLAIELMLDQPAMIKRPILDLGERRVLGFKDALYQEEFSPK